MLDQRLAELQKRGSARHAAGSMLWAMFGAWRTADGRWHEVCGSGSWQAAYVGRYCDVSQ